ncbi:MAG: ATP-binding cassette domain-containing protein [Woeseiaceae bacterium]|nr:ATP-binding cassette domain-containing protein [Woeseiaceae bacterium]
MTLTAPPDARVRIDNVTRSFAEGERRHTVLADVSAEFASGETIALRGRSGSGKSTLLNLVCGIDTPDSGRICIGSHDITAMSERDRTLIRRKHIGFVYQAFNLVPTLTVADNVRLGTGLNRVAAAEAAQRVDEVLDAVGLAGRRDSFPEVLSGGEQQRVAIARALADRCSSAARRRTDGHPVRCDGRRRARPAGAAAPRAGRNADRGHAQRDGGGDLRSRAGAARRAARRGGLMRTLTRASAGYLWRHPWQLALALLGIAIGRCRDRRGGPGQQQFADGLQPVDGCDRRRGNPPGRRRAVRPGRRPLHGPACRARCDRHRPGRPGHRDGPARRRGRAGSVARRPLRSSAWTRSRNRRFAPIPCPGIPPATRARSSAHC